MPSASPLLRPAGALDDEKGLHAIPLDVLLLKKYGSEYLAWESSALYIELEEDFGAVGPSTWARIQAVRVLHVNPAFWREWEVFEKVTAGIAGYPPVFSYMQPPEPYEMAVALHVAQQVSQHLWDGDVLGYTAAACLDDGLWYLEAPLNVAEPLLLEHDRRKNIERPYGQVAARLQEVSSFIQEPVGHVDSQVNLVLGVRATLQAYKAQERQQLRSHS